MFSSSFFSEKKGKRRNKLDKFITGVAETLDVRFKKKKMFFVLFNLTFDPAFFKNYYHSQALDTPVNYEIWLYFIMQQKCSKNI